MRIARASMGLILALSCVCLHADESDPQKVTLVGTLHRAMARFDTHGLGGDVVVQLIPQRFCFPARYLE